MIKLKLTKEMLFCLCSFTRPAVYEAKASGLIKNQNFAYLDFLFNLVQIGEKASKLYLFGNKAKHTMSISCSEGASLMAHICSLQREKMGGYNEHVAELLKADLHEQLTNYQPKFYGSQQTTSSYEMALINQIN